jgi:hypothetical protein
MSDLKNKSDKIPNITPEMIKAGVKIVWPDSEAPALIERQVAEIYRAMDFLKHTKV